MITEGRLAGVVASVALAAITVTALSADAKPSEEKPTSVQDNGDVPARQVTSRTDGVIEGSYGNCYGYTRTIYSMSCDFWVNHHSVRLSMRFNEPPGANRVVTSTGWLDGTNDYSGRTWNGPLGQSADRRAHYLWRACTWHWYAGLVCSPWVN